MRSSAGGVGAPLVELKPVECFELLARQQVGRIVYFDALGPVALPVNFVVHAKTVLVRTSPHGSLASHLRETPRCAFEVDDVNLALQSGWSVLVRGSAAWVRHPDTAACVEWPRPWPAGSRPLLIRITPVEVSGRRLLPA
jgi:uncharacterized protein